MASLRVRSATVVGSFAIVTACGTTDSDGALGVANPEPPGVALQPDAPPNQAGTPANVAPPGETAPPAGPSLGGGVAGAEATIQSPAPVGAPPASVVAEQEAILLTAPEEDETGEPQACAGTVMEPETLVTIDWSLSNG